jgi:hypothetical protein
MTRRHIRQRLVSAKRIAAWGFLLLVVPAMQAQTAEAPQLSPEQAETLLQHALANEISAAENSRHPMRYRLHKVTPHLTTTKKIIETSDGDVARLISVNGKPLSAAAEQKEMARLDALTANPADQNHRKESESSDTGRAIKILRALPTAFVYRYTGPGTSGAGSVEAYTFAPNRNYSPTGMETQILTAMTGKISIDPGAQRVVHLEGHLQHSVDYGLGIIGRLNKGGWIALDEAPVVNGLWRTVRLQMAMTGRILFFTKSYDLLEEESDFKPVAKSLDYREAIGMLKKDP